jgi:hypothetical protein
VRRADAKRLLELRYPRSGSEHLSSRRLVYTDITERIDSTMDFAESTEHPGPLLIRCAPDDALLTWPDLFATLESRVLGGGRSGRT